MFRLTMLQQFARKLLVKNLQKVISKVLLSILHNLNFEWGWTLIPFVFKQVRKCKPDPFFPFWQTFLHTAKPAGTVMTSRVWCRSLLMASDKRLMGFATDVSAVRYTLNLSLSSVRSAVCYETKWATSWDEPTHFCKFSKNMRQKTHDAKKVGLQTA
jgi:hypothetical protein